MSVLMPSEFETKRLLDKYPALDAGGNHITGTITDSIADLYNHPNRELAAEIMAARQWMSNVLPTRVWHGWAQAYKLKHRVEEWSVACSYPKQKWKTISHVSAAAFVLAADHAGHEIKLVDGCYWCRPRNLARFAC
jgi:hypothetical protein